MPLKHFSRKSFKQMLKEDDRHIYVYDYEIGRWIEIFLLVYARFCFNMTPRLKYLYYMYLVNLSYSELGGNIYM